MVVITFRKIREFVGKYKQTKVPLYQWYKCAEQANWTCFNDIKQDFSSADYVGDDRYVFNIKGNHFRLIAMIHFDIRTVYIRFIGTHKEYDDVEADKV